MRHSDPQDQDPNLFGNAGFGPYIMITLRIRNPGIATKLYYVVQSICMIQVSSTVELFGPASLKISLGVGTSSRIHRSLTGRESRLLHRVVVPARQSCSLDLWIRQQKVPVITCYTDEQWKSHDSSYRTERLNTEPTDNLHFLPIASQR